MGLFGNSIGGSSWNEVKEQVRKEHPDWPLKKQLKEASRRYKGRK